ncbi:Palmitoyltransferase, partial [Globisporangium splendens]
MATWLAIVRFHSSALFNASYVVATLLMLWSYFLSVTVQPRARPPNDNRVRAEEDAGSGDKEEAMRYCERCDMNKTASMHHCSACHRCVYRMDHHCPWTNNCVGWDNKKYFLLFLLYTSASCLLFNGMVLEIMWHHTTRYETDKSLLQLTWTLSLAIGGILAGYFLFHIWLLYQGKTTLELITGKHGELEGNSLCANMKVYFGSNVALWWLPVAPTFDTMTMHERERGVRYQRESEQLMV